LVIWYIFLPFRYVVERKIGHPDDHSGFSPVPGFPYLTILLQVAAPLVGDALAVGALEEVVCADGAVAVGLVAPVAAVVVEVAPPQVGDALLAVRASKLRTRIIRHVYNWSNIRKNHFCVNRPSA
jgi:hypothetical protein